MTCEINSGFKVLVIEDDTVTRMTICHVLRKHNYNTIEACNGLMGLAKFKRESPDIILTDLVMPDKAGLETIFSIHSLNPHARIVAMTGGIGDAASELLAMAQEVGAQRWLCKPFTPEQLVSVIEDVRRSAAKT